jgi:hypothetical protein
MKAISGVFISRSGAENAVKEIRKAGVPGDRVTLLIPGTVDQVEHEVESVPVDDAEQAGIGKAIGALMGGGVGATGGALLVALVPGVGPISALGLLGAAILGAAGATAGAAVGGRVEASSSEGLPHDEIYVYEDALRKGRSVVIALAESEESASALRDLLRANGAETIDAARQQWWVGLRDVEESHYSRSGRNFANDEKFYRMGFEAALHAKTRCLEFDQVSGEMNAALEDLQRKYPGVDLEEAFTTGYQRGREYYQRVCNEGQKAA